LNGPPSSGIPTTSPATGPTPRSPRARDATEIFIIDTPTEQQLDRDEIGPHCAKELRDERTPRQRLEAAMRRRDDEDLAIDRIDPPAYAPTDNETPAGTSTAHTPRISVAELRRQLEHVRAQMGKCDRLAELQTMRITGADAQRTADDARARIAELERQAGGLLRRRHTDPVALAFERQRERQAEDQVKAAAQRERGLLAGLADRTGGELASRDLRERAAELEAKLSLHRREHVRQALDRPAGYLTATLGARPEEPRARRTWERAAERVEAYRFDHTVTAPEDALGPQPNQAAQRGQWRRVQKALERAQRDLGRHIDHVLGHEL
jgi:hypothetical protein